MIGQVEFNSATFYRYAAIDVNKLVKNLQDDKELAMTGIRSFIQSMARAIPSGKQSTFAAHNPPAFVGIALRNSSPFNLANAFEKPVWPRLDKELSALSVEKLADHDDKLSAAYGDGKDRWAYLDISSAWPSQKGEEQKSLDALVKWTSEQVRPDLGA
jgi:CRISPR system Cascade subunit CasC